jgi:uncharacterized protein
MAKDHIGYEALADQALRSVVKEALKRVEKQGLIGAHHFYLTFKTHDPGVELPEFLAERYPEEMTIVLQNQFWGLKVSDDRFEVSLTFQKLPAALVIPFASLTAFVDPGVQFGLQFRDSDTAKKASASREATKVPAVPPEKPAPAKAPQDAAAAKQPSTVSPAGPQVVSIDKFRKK